ncbi:MAG TPA: glutathione S-transferase N-terminal domain-containing protein [Solirubrobacteraceae bacterium]|nr:glutathione S-transferase N-terminal domain-containing protein [Solirubrobacteraceae bacterium]
MNLTRHTLHTCNFGDRGGSIGHPCGRAAKALREHGHEFEVHIAAVGHPFGVATAGRRPQIKALSGQEKLPVLELADGTVIAGSNAIIEWARGNRPA